MNHYSFGVYEAMFRYISNSDTVAATRVYGEMYSVYNTALREDFTTPKSYEKGSVLPS